jgi:Raf kinase inhibitor-like YbhB/YbcL family protein
MKRLVMSGFMALTGVINAAEFSVTSSDLRANHMMGKTQEFSGFGCSGANQSPQLSWSNAPLGTKSFAITVYDPDAPTGSGWWHWLVVNLPATTTSLASNASVTGLPAGALQTRTDFGAHEYGGACPPAGHGVHHYQHTVWALKVDKLDLTADASGALVGYYLNANALGKTTLTATYERH